MNRSVPPPADEDPFVVNRVADEDLHVSVPFELEVSEWETDGSAGGTGESWGTAGDYGLE